MNEIVEVIDKDGFKTLKVISQADRFNKWMYETIQPYVKGRILEIGSGIGNISKYFIHSGATICLSDINPYYLQLLQEHYTSFQNVISICAIDLQHPSFKQAYNHLKHQFDSLIILNVLEHLENDKTALDNCSFLLKPGGTLVILVPAYSLLYSELDRALGHYRRYSKNTLLKLLQPSPLTAKKCFYFNAFGIIGWLYSKVLRLRSLPNREMKLFNKVVPLVKKIDTWLCHQIGVSVITVAVKTE